MPQDCFHHCFSDSLEIKVALSLSFSLELCFKMSKRSRNGRYYAHMSGETLLSHLIILMQTQSRTDTLQMFYILLTLFKVLKYHTQSTSIQTDQSFFFPEEYDILTAHIFKIDFRQACVARHCAAPRFAHFIQHQNQQHNLVIVF